jgi:hypothetical protein
MIGVHLTLEATNATLDSNSEEAALLRAELRDMLNRFATEWNSKCEEINQRTPLKYVAFMR